MFPEQLLWHNCKWCIWTHIVYGYIMIHSRKISIASNYLVILQYSVNITLHWVKQYLKTTILGALRRK